MGKVVFITGGASSGKTAYALGRAVQYAEPRLYIATAQALDEEMEKRIELHRLEREGKGFDTLEAPLGLVSVIKGLDSKYSAVLVDCLTLWLSNLLGAGRDVEAEIQQFLSALGTCAPDVYLVTNEVGMGIVPDNELARAFRDHSGRMNALMAQAASEAWVCVSGLTLKLK